MSQRSVCNQFTPQLWRATKCKFCFNDKESHEKATKDNPSLINSNLLTSPTVKSPVTPKPIKRLNSSFISTDENITRDVTSGRHDATRDVTSGCYDVTSFITRSPTRRNTSSNSINDGSRPEKDPLKHVPTRMRIALSPEERSPSIASLTSPIDTINIRLEMNKQLLAKDDTIHNLEIRNQNLENEIRTLKEQNVQLAKCQQSEEDHRTLLDKVASLRRKLSDMEVRNAKLKEEKIDLEENLKLEEQTASKLKIKINGMEHEHYLLELKVEREQKHKYSVAQEKEEAEQELESLRKSYRSMQRESRRLSTTYDVEDERSRELEDQLRQTQRRLGLSVELMCDDTPPPLSPPIPISSNQHSPSLIPTNLTKKLVEVENCRLKDKMNKVEVERADNQISTLQRQLSTAQVNYDESVVEIEDLRQNHLSEIQSLQSQISRLQSENDELNEGVTKKSLEVKQMLRRLSDADATKSEAISKDEEVQSLRAEVSRLQDKCSALCDVELIHINLNKELDRQRDRADGAEQGLRALTRQMEEERAQHAQFLLELNALRAKEVLCKQRHSQVDPPPVRTRSSSLEPALFSPNGGLLKKIREPAERDNASPSQSTRFTKPAPPANRRRPSRDHLQKRARDSEV